MGTYDFYSPTLHPFGHAEVDVIPWIEWGNNPQDSTTKEKRICTMSNNWKGELALKYLNYNYEYCD